MSAESWRGPAVAVSTLMNANLIGCDAVHRHSAQGSLWDLKGLGNGPLLSTCCAASSYRALLYRALCKQMELQMGMLLPWTRSMKKLEWHQQQQLLNPTQLMFDGWNSTKYAAMHENTGTCLVDILTTYAVLARQAVVVTHNSLLVVNCSIVPVKARNFAKCTLRRGRKHVGIIWMVTFRASY